MEVYKFDKPTQVIFRYICENPKTDVIHLECLTENTFEKKKDEFPDEQKMFNDYAHSCADYLLECGLIYAINEHSHTYYSVSAKGMAYLKYRKSNLIEKYFPFAVSLISVTLSVVAFIISII